MTTTGKKSTVAGKGSDAVKKRKTSAKKSPKSESKTVRNIPESATPTLNDGMLNIAIKAARRAGDIQMRAFYSGQALKISAKAAGDFVTQIDKESEEVIVSTLSEAFPDHGFLGEEFGDSGKPDAEYVWVIDPLDGTTNFIHHIPQFAVSIACLKDGKLIHAVVYDPCKNELFTATRGKGALLDNRRIRVSNTLNMQEALIGTGFPFREQDNYDAYMRVLRPLMEESAGLRRPGSAALDLCWTACGRYDAFWESGLKPWDLAAGSLIALEAGAFVTDFEGEDGYLQSGNIVAGTPKIFVPLLANIKKNWNPSQE